MTNKQIILAMPSLFGIHEAIEDNLRFYGFDVIPLIHDEAGYRYRNFWDRVKKFYHRNILGDKNYKKELMFSYHSPKFFQKLDAVEGKTAYCLMIWPGVFPNSFMKVLRDKARLMVHYNWEALDFLDDDFPKIRYFDKFFFFDPYDIGKRPEYADILMPTTSFYFDCYAGQEETANNSLFFLGSHAKQRIGDIRAFHAAAKELGLEVDFHIASKNPASARSELGLDDIRYFPFSEALPYKENLKRVKKSSVLVDFLNNKHHGLSLRTFESIGFEKKLITTNHTVVHYDFYHPDNIFVWDGGNRAGLLDFLKKPYRPLDADIRQKYSFGNWIRYVLDIPPHRPVTLPEIG